MDQFGVKPLYYKNKENIVFSSEQKAQNKLYINENSLSDYLNFQFYLSNETLIEGLNEVSQTYVEINLSNLTIKEKDTLI